VPPQSYSLRTKFNDTISKGQHRWTTNQLTCKIIEMIIRDIHSFQRRVILNLADDQFATLTVNQRCWYAQLCAAWADKLAPANNKYQ
jgi:hypothetical protein